MNKTLIIEIKDNSTFVTLANISKGSWSILFSKNYHFDFDNIFIHNKSKVKVNYSISWMQEMIDDIDEIFSIKEIDNTFLCVNNSYSVLRTYKIKTGPETNEREIFNQVLKSIKEGYKDIKIMSMNLDSVTKTPINKFYDFSYELINKNLWDTLISFLKSFGINVTKTVSSKESIYSALKPYINRSNNLFNIQIEDNFTSINFISNKKFIKSEKTEQGLNLIYKKISKKFNIPLKTSKKLFEKYGNIPPEAIVDNRIIFNGYDKDDKKIYFSKKDLSKIITEYIDLIFKNIKEYINKKNVENPELIFSGKISKLKGFEKYAKDSFKLKNVGIFKTNIIGLELRTEIISVGTLYWAEDKIKSYVTNSEQDKIGNKIYKRKGIVQLILDKFNKYYNYV